MADNSQYFSEVSTHLTEILFPTVSSRLFSELNVDRITNFSTLLFLDDNSDLEFRTIDSLM